MKAVNANIDTKWKKSLHMIKAEFKMKSRIIPLPGSKESFKVMNPMLTSKSDDPPPPQHTHP